MTERHGARSVLSNGYIALDVVKTSDGTWLRSGGTASNVAGNLAFLGWSSALLGVIGADDAGRIVKDDLESAGVNTSRLRLLPDAGTPIVLHRIDVRGHRYSFGCSLCGRRYVRHRPVSNEDVRDALESMGLASVFFFDRPSAGAVAMARSHAAAGRLVFYEPSTTGRADGHREAATLAHVVKYSAERAKSFREPIPDDAGVLQIITYGQDGLAFRLRDTTWRRQGGFTTAAVDAAGAGDWLTAVLIHLLPTDVDAWTDDSVWETLSTAQAAAAISCTLPGARSLASSVTREELTREIDLIRSGRTPNPLSMPDFGRASADRLCDECLLPLGLVG